MVTKHAEERIVQRYRDNDKATMLRDLRDARKINNFCAIPNPAPGRATLFFSRDYHFLWKVVISKKDGAVITTLPITPWDLSFALEKGVIDNNKRAHKVKIM